MKKIILIGMRGVGKTFFGKKLATDLMIPFFDLDEVIENKFGESIKTFVKKKSFEAFRDQEEKLFEELLHENESMVISCGGGIVERKKNRELLKKEPFVIHVQRDLDEIIKYLSKDTTRPQLSDLSIEEEVRDVWKRREPFYTECSKYTMLEGKGEYEKILEMF